jgi:hypothetical protein
MIGTKLQDILVAILRWHFYLYTRIMSGTFTTFDLSGFLAVPSSLKVTYQSYWGTFELVQNYNLNISTLRSAGDMTQTYYIFTSYEEQNAYTNGRMLHIQRYPNSNWAPVPKD